MESWWLNKIISLIASAVTNMKELYRKHNKAIKTGMQLQAQLMHSLQRQCQSPARCNLLSHGREPSIHLVLSHTDI